MEFIREVLGIISQYYSYLLSGVGYTMLIALDRYSRRLSASVC